MTDQEGLLLRHAPRRVCFVLLTGIGDVVHGLPLAWDLRRSHAPPELVWVAEPAPAEVLRHHPAVDRVVVFRKGQGLRGLQRLMADFRELRCDLTVNFMRYAKGLFPLAAARSPVRLGLPRSKTRDLVHLAHTHLLDEGPWCHTQDLFLRFREPLGISPGAPVEWGITFSASEQAERDAFFRELRARAPGPIVGLVLATANPAKDWPARHSVAAARALVAELDATVLLIGGPSEREREAAAAIVREVPRGVVDGLGDSVRRMMWMVDGVDLLVSPDTGPLHVAHALDVPVVGLFGHTNPWRVGPWRRYHDLVLDRYTDPGEEPDPSRYDPRHERMPRIEVEAVIEKVEIGLGRYGRSRERRGGA